jgi:hypothetical protein
MPGLISTTPPDAIADAETNTTDTDLEPFLRRLDALPIADFDDAESRPMFEAFTGQSLDHIHILGSEGITRDKLTWGIIWDAAKVYVGANSISRSDETYRRHLEGVCFLLASSLVGHHGTQLGVTEE